MGARVRVSSGIRAEQEKEEAARAMVVQMAWKLN